MNMEMKKLIAIIATAGVFFTAARLLLVENPWGTPVLAALWGAAGTAALLYWPRKGCVQLLSLCWLCVVLYGIAALELAGCAEVREEDAYMPGPVSLLIFLSVPFFLVLLPIAVYFLRSIYRDHMRTVLEEAVLAATDPLAGPEDGAMEKALQLLKQGTPADYIADALVSRDELVFQAVETPNPQAVANALELLPLLAKAGAGISRDSLDSAKYNCPPAIQAELQKLPLTP